MSTDWYLMGKIPTFNSGFETEEFNNYAIDGFDELLADSPISESVSICDANKTIIKTFKAIVNNNTVDNAKKSTERQILTDIGVLQTGDYVMYRNKLFLIISYPDNNGFYEKAIMGLCNYTLTWQSPNGTILSYPCIDTTTSTMGLNESNTLTTPNSIHTIKLPFDEHTLLINTDDRFFIDDLSVEVPQVFAVSKPNRTEFRYGDKGLIELTMKQSSFKNDGTDRKDLGVCDYFEPVIRPSINCEIIFKTPSIVCIGGKSKIFTAKYFDSQGVEITTPIAVWSHNIPLADQNKILFKVDSVNPNICTLQVTKDFKLTTKNNIIRLSLTDSTGFYNTYLDVKIEGAIG